MIYLLLEERLIKHQTIETELYKIKYNQITKYTTITMTVLQKD